jgi:glycosyltransferase involved in cell wall biosynthesis
MRILHVTDGYGPRLGGIEVFVEGLARHQSLAGHEVSVLTATPALPDADVDPDTAAGTGAVRVVRTPPSLLHPLAPRAAREVATTGHFDVVHSHLSVVSPFATVVARASDEAGLPTVNTVHSMWASRRPVVRAVGALADWGRAGTVWTAVSAAAAAEMGQVLPPDVDVQVVHNAVDVDWWRAAAPAPRLARPEARTITFVSVMRIAGRKRPGALLSIVQAVRERLPEDVTVRLVVAGDGPLSLRFEAEIDRLGLHGTVTSCGRLDRAALRDLYAAAHVFVSPVLEESFGIAALEARACGLPVVAMRAGGVGEFIEHGVSGLLCEDDDAMVDVLVRIAVDGRLLRLLAEHNARVRPPQDWTRAVQAFDEVYDDARSRAAQVHGSGGNAVIRSSA